MKTLLIVDDSRVSHATLKLALKDENLNIISVYGGEEALSLILKTPCPDLVLLDLHMPKMGGLELLTECQKRGLRVSVLVVTADITTSTAEQCMKLGAIGVVAKPIAGLNSEVCKKVQEFFESDAASKSAAL